MLYPPMADLVQKVGSRYLLVNLVARRARQIADIEEESGESSERKAVASAIEEVYTGKLAIQHSESHDNSQYDSDIQYGGQENPH
jgi:DNA-directed RNA polymerase, omega subunit